MIGNGCLADMEERTGRVLAPGKREPVARSRKVMGTANRLSQGWPLFELFQRTGEQGATGVAVFQNACDLFRNRLEFQTADQLLAQRIGEQGEFRGHNTN